MAAQSPTRMPACSRLLANTSTSGLRAPSWLVQYSAMDATRGVLPLPLPTTISAFLCFQ